MKKTFRFVLDTNILLVSISSKSKYHWIYQSLLQQKYEIAITNDILMEYEEIISNKYSKSVAKNVIRNLLLSNNVKQTEIFYNWDLIQQDKDDNKFVDCAIASNADYIVTNDKHFNCLDEVEFPIVKCLNIDQFKEFCRMANIVY
jgi:putative PIN family toxin of toxin-antitoxin system